MKAIYEIDYDFKGDIVIELDESNSKQLDELMHEVNSFWSGADERLLSEDGDIKAVFLKMLCDKLLRMDIRTNLGVAGLIREMSTEEGYPLLDGSCGVRLISINGVVFESSEMTIKEL